MYIDKLRILKLKNALLNSCRLCSLITGLFLFSSLQPRLTTLKQKTKTVQPLKIK